MRYSVKFQLTDAPIQVEADDESEAFTKGLYSLIRRLEREQGIRLVLVKPARRRASRRRRPRILTPEEFA